RAPGIPLRVGLRARHDLGKMAGSPCCSGVPLDSLADVTGPRAYQAAVFAEFNIMGDIAIDPCHREHSRKIVAGYTELMKHRAFVEFDVGVNFLASRCKFPLAGSLHG